MSEVSRITEGKTALVSNPSAWGNRSTIRTSRVMPGSSGQDAVNGTDGTIFTALGDWNSVTTYDALDMVCYTRATGGNGSTYVSVKGANTNNSPSAGGVWWVRVSESGEQGGNGSGGDNIPPIDGIGIFRNGWITAKSYNETDAVYFNGSLFICIAAHTSGNGNRPESGTGKWRYVAKGGSDGSKGPRGEDGKDGTDGEDGKDGYNGVRGPMGGRGATGTDGTNGQDGAVGGDATNLAQMSDTEGIGSAVEGNVLTKKANGKWGPITPTPSGGPNFNQEILTGFPGQTMDGWNKGTANFNPQLDPENVFGISPNAVLTKTENGWFTLDPDNYLDRSLISTSNTDTSSPKPWQGGFVYYQVLGYSYEEQGLFLKKPGESALRVGYANYNDSIYEAHGPVLVQATQNDTTGVSIRYTYASDMGAESVVASVIPRTGTYSSGTLYMASGNGYIWIFHQRWGSAWMHVSDPTTWNMAASYAIGRNDYAVDANGAVSNPYPPGRVLYKTSLSGVIDTYNDVLPVGLTGGNYTGIHWTDTTTAHICSKDGRPHIYLVSPNSYQALWTGAVMETGGTATFNYGLGRDGMNLIAAPIIGGGTPSGPEDFTRGHVLVKLNLA